MISPEAAGLIGAVVGGLVGGLRGAKQARDEVDALQRRVAELEKRQQSLIDNPPMLMWPDVNSDLLPV